MTNKEPAQSQFKDYPSLKETIAKKRAQPSIFSEASSVDDRLKFQNKQYFEIPKDLTRVQRFDHWVRKNPRRFHFIFLGIGLSIFFSRPLYDLITYSLIPNVKLGLAKIRSLRSE